MKIKILLLIITIWAFFLRAYQVNNYPSLLWDEAALGYNSYSILKTGRDEFGKLLPFTLQSFGDYKPALYSYLAIPFVGLLGLNELSVRLPSIILGALCPLLLYLLILKLSPQANRLGIIAAIILAFNPINIIFSRGAWETNVLTFELLLASYWFFNHRYLLSSIIFGLTLYTYQGAKLISLLLILTLFFLNHQVLKTKIQKIIHNFIFPLGLMAIPITLSLFSSGANRLQVVSLFSYPRIESEVNTIISESNSFDYNLFYSRPQFFIRNFLSRYFNHISPQFLAFVGDWQNSRHTAPYTGELLIPTYILFVVGFFWLLSQKSDVAKYKYFLFWLILAPLPGALTRDSVTAVRTMNLSIPLVFLAAYAIDQLIHLVPKFYIKPFYGLLITAYGLSFIYFSELYYHHLLKHTPGEYLYGYRQAMNHVLQNGQNKQITFTDFYGQPYIYYLFYSQYPPSIYQKTNHYLSGGIDTGKVESIDNLRFTSTQFADIKNKPNNLAIFSWDEILRQGINNSPDFANFIPLSPINNLSTFYAYQTN
ncbi:phospholipid carrier-dependent glycosyltransferase [Candidatus Shapirobacteria bacterium]|nr:phospholipid carrier-dependent glycosyltransferase [Candidatus Shapirobacteria bacterium]